MSKKNISTKKKNATLQSFVSIDSTNLTIEEGKNNKCNCANIGIVSIDNIDLKIEERERNCQRNATLQIFVEIDKIEKR